MRIKKADAYKEIFASEMLQGEITHWKLHWVLYGIVLGLSSVVYFVQGIDSGKYGILLSLINLAYNSGLTYFILKKKTMGWVGYVTVFLNVFSLTVYNFLDSALNSPLASFTTATIVLYPVIIFLASLRMDKYLIVWATILSIVAMDGVYFWFYPQFDPQISSRLVSADILGQVYRTVYLAICGILMYTVPSNMRRMLQAQEKLAHESRLHQQASERDPLTGVANRLYLRRYLESALASSRITQQPVAVCYIDLDEFKAMNDTFGHEAGDYILRMIAKDIQHVVRMDDLVARIGGDEFVVVIRSAVSSQECEILGNRIASVIAQKRFYQDIPIQATASIGIALYPNDAMEIDTLLKKADEAMYDIKKSGKHNLLFYKDRTTHQ